MSSVRMYHKNIEEIIVEYILDANSSIRIIMAWFTSKVIKDALIDLKKKKNHVSIEIVVDSNEINDKYFLNYKEKFQIAGIVICEKINEPFLHDKILIIDNKKIITGSYNYSNKAKSNFENIVIIEDETISLTNSRIFNFLTDKNYIDENISLLFKYPHFAQEIIWAYYNFSTSEYKKYKNKIIIGECFTHDNGMHDEIKYYPGFIFNNKVTLEKAINSSEFPLPITKQFILNWIKGRNEGIILDYYSDKEDFYEFITDDLHKNENAINLFFQRKISSTHRFIELEKYILDGVDIIKEDYLWSCNFLLFLNKKLIEDIFKKFPLSDGPILYPKNIFGL